MDCWKKKEGERADLSEANLIGADLTGADLNEANLRWADLTRAHLSEAHLTGADLRRANLSDADLTGSDLRGANIKDTIINFPISCPEEGSFIGFKKCSSDLIVELEITEDALRCSATGRKCRCSKAKVVSITNIDGTIADVTSISSKHDPDFIYTVGEIVEVKNFDTNRWNECSTGIHFFITRDEAVDYVN